jgi:hypothetical protein
LARVDGGGAAAEDFGCVDVEGLRVEGEGPEVVFSGGGGVGWGGEEGGAVWLNLVARVGLVVEIYIRD